MGGFGSGRPGWKRKTGEMLRLVAGTLHKGGAFAEGTAGAISWNRGDGDKPSVSFRGGGDSLKLMFRVRTDGEEWEDVAQVIHLEHTPCGFGGERPWFLCPRCGRRVGVLYGRRLFLCRACQRLAYPSQSEPRHDRMLRRANKIRARLGGEAGISARIEKPKRMRWATFMRMVEEIHELEDGGLLLAMEKYGMTF